MIKTLAIVLLVLSTIGLSYELSTAKKKSLDIAQNSFETGCYTFAQGYCSTLEEGLRYECYNTALESCPAQAKAFRDWIETGK